MFVARRVGNTDRVLRILFVCRAEVDINILIFLQSSDSLLL